MNAGLPRIRKMFLVQLRIAELVEEAPCETKEQLRRKIEGQHIRNEECINKRIEGRTVQRSSIKIIG
jgi:hypothetical protein